eukprot:491053-Amorphochlora_amoeboformis.AAC.1
MEISEANGDFGGIFAIFSGRILLSEVSKHLSPVTHNVRAEGYRESHDFLKGEPNLELLWDK